MKMSLIHTNALLVATTDLDHAKRRAQAALTQLPLLEEDAKSPQELKARVLALQGDLKAILARIASADSRIRICIHDETSPENPAPVVLTPAVSPVPATTGAVPTKASAKAPAPASPWSAENPPTDAPLYEDFEGVRIRVGAAKPRAGYVHYRSRRHVLAESLEVGIPAAVIHHTDLMTPNLKPTALGWKRAEKLIVQVREAVSKGISPDPLWQKWAK